MGWARQEAGKIFSAAKRQKVDNRCDLKAPHGAGGGMIYAFGKSQAAWRSMTGKEEDASGGGGDVGGLIVVFVAKKCVAGVKPLVCLG